ncbi:hypothetical protein CYFUS_001097 [Cystobacter fuscus]|uniref:Uncharacterized protein n=1 Tax=Cystobacter fuscus TaxID=43 RepID=A0A250IWM7_9BACT|nr:hypothetical protein [Cystobacter fuscus]ATB35683.1 hypothetical protein CYFUS_001097 [Cystobacter fuscus]
MTPTTLLVLAALADAPAAPPPAHQLSFYARSGLTAYLSSARTQGGLGGGVGVRDTLRGLWLLQADVNGLTGLGSVLEVRLGAGVQRPSGGWRPAALVSLTGLFGDQLGFVMPGESVYARGPALGVGLTLAPARFSLGSAQVSLVELGVGVGGDGVGRGPIYSLTLLEVGLAL